jgi:hypothetical protein
VIWLVPFSDLEDWCLLLTRREGEAVAFLGTNDIDDGVIGSTWTMWLQDCTIALIRDVLPMLESPAINTFKRPMALPVSVKGRRLGILILGMISCGALPLSIMFGVPASSFSASPPSSSLRT